MPDPDPLSPIRYRQAESIGTYPPTIPLWFHDADGEPRMVAPVPPPSDGEA
jgi:hypothetical protein